MTAAAAAAAFLARLRQAVTTSYSPQHPNPNFPFHPQARTLSAGLQRKASTLSLQGCIDLLNAVLQGPPLVRAGQ